VIGPAIRTIQAFQTQHSLVNNVDVGFDSDHSYFEPEWDALDDMRLRLFISATMDDDFTEQQRIDDIMLNFTHITRARVYAEYRLIVDVVEALENDQPPPPSPPRIDQPHLQFSAPPAAQPQPPAAQPQPPAQPEFPDMLPPPAIRTIQAFHMTGDCHELFS
jgi:hypothetical protein